MRENRPFITGEPHALIKMFRTRPRPGNPKKFTQKMLATLIGRDPRTIREWESGLRLPAPESLRRLIQVFVWQRIFVEGKEREEAQDLWESVHISFATKSMRLTEYPPFDVSWFDMLLRNRGQALTSSSAVLETPPFGLSHTSAGMDEIGHKVPHLHALL